MVNAVYVPTYTSNHVPTGWVACVRDITVQQQPEERLRDSELTAQPLAAIVQSSNDAIISKDLDGVITSWNRAAERLFGYTAAEVVGPSVRVIIPDDGQAEEGSLLTTIRGGGGVENLEAVRRCKDGTPSSCR